MRDRFQKFLLLISRIRYSKDKHLYIGVFAFMALLLFIFFGLYIKMRADLKVRDNILESYYDQPQPGKDIQEPGRDKIKVYICGEVIRPGVYEISREARVSDVLKLAGGPGPDAALQSINLARRVTDEEKISVPSLEDIKSQEQKSSGLININSASQHLLETLPGIGPATAENILEYREKEGPFKKIEDIKEVWGIGDKKFQEIKGLISV